MIGDDPPDDCCSLHYFVRQRLPEDLSRLPVHDVTGCVIYFTKSDKASARQRHAAAFASLWPAVLRFPSLRRLALLVYMSSGQVKALAGIHPSLCQPDLEKPLDVFRLFSREHKDKHYVELKPASLEPTGMFIPAKVDLLACIFDHTDQ